MKKLKKSKLISVRGNKQFPKEGWIQSCYFCLIPKSKFTIVDKYKIYACNSCQKKYAKEINEWLHDT